MTYLVADVGGTNTRLALAGEDRLRSDSVVRFANDAFETFEEVLRAYRTDHADRLSACCIAIAGPVTATRARLTNRNWEFDPATLSSKLDGAGVELVNDLVALGRAVPVLSERTLQTVRPGNAARRANGQTLVVGVGTGFNVCLAKENPQGPPFTTEAEVGHSSMPDWMRGELAAILGSEADRFVTIEDCLSGRGLSAIYGILSGGAERPSHEVLAAAAQGDDAPARAAVDLTAALLGLYTRELICLFLPFGGICFAGGVARGVLLSPARDVFLEAAHNAQGLSPEFERIPISLISEDTAALTGCLSVLSESRTLT